MHFNGFICIRFKPMHLIEAKLCRHLVFQMKCHSEIFSDKKVIANFWVIGQNFGLVYMHRDVSAF